MSSSATGIADANPFETAVAAPPVGKIDELVFARLKELDIEPAAVCSDAVFVRRVYLDVIGTLPTAEQVRRFLEDDNPKKRQSLVDELLQTTRVRRLLGAQMERPATRQSGVPH